MQNRFVNQGSLRLPMDAGLERELDCRENTEKLDLVELYEEYTQLHTACGGSGSVEVGPEKEPSRRAGWQAEKLHGRGSRIWSKSRTSGMASRN